MLNSKVKLEIIKRFSDSWRDLAIALEIPTADQNRFPNGWEAQAIWEWLEARGRLDALPGALQHINREDLVELWRPPTGFRQDVSRLPTTFASGLFGRQQEMDQLVTAWDSTGADKTNIVALDAMGARVRRRW